MARIVLAIAAILAGAALYPAASVSAEEWCWNDPTLSINGKTVHFQVGAPLSKRELIRSTTLVVIVPINVSAQLTGAGNENFPMSVTLLNTGPYWNGNGAIPVTATAVVTAGTDVSTGFKVWQSSVGVLGETPGVGGQTMLLSIGVQ